MSINLKSLCIPMVIRYTIKSRNVEDRRLLYEDDYNNLYSPVTQLPQKHRVISDILKSLKQQKIEIENQVFTSTVDGKPRYLLSIPFIRTIPSKCLKMNMFNNIKSLLYFVANPQQFKKQRHPFNYNQYFQQKIIKQKKNSKLTYNSAKNILLSPEEDEIFDKTLIFNKRNDDEEEEEKKSDDKLVEGDVVKSVLSQSQIENALKLLNIDKKSINTLLCVLFENYYILRWINNPKNNKSMKSIIFIVKIKTHSGNKKFRILIDNGKRLSEVLIGLKMTTDYNQREFRTLYQIQMNYAYNYGSYRVPVLYPCTLVNIPQTNNTGIISYGMSLYFCDAMTINSGLNNVLKIGSKNSYYILIVTIIHETAITAYELKLFPQIYHRDIKPQNIFITINRRKCIAFNSKNGNNNKNNNNNNNNKENNNNNNKVYHYSFFCALGDYGLSKVSPNHEQKNKINSGRIGTELFNPPILNNDHDISKVHVFQLGMTLVYMINMKKAQSVKDIFLDDDMDKNEKKKKILPLLFENNQCSDLEVDIYNVLCCCIANEEEDRLDMKQFVYHPFFIRLCGESYINKFKQFTNLSEVYDNIHGKLERYKMQQQIDQSKN